MSDFFDSEEEESGEEIGSGSEEDVAEDEEIAQQEETTAIDDANDIINDDDSDGDEEDEGEDNIRTRKRKDFHDAVDEEDLDLIEENLGINLDRRKYKRLKKLKPIDSDEEEDDRGSVGGHSADEREALAHELFEDDEIEQLSRAISTTPVEPTNDQYAVLDDSESDVEDDFIVDDDNQPVHERSRKKGGSRTQNRALQEAQDIFGLDFDFGDFEKFGQEEYSDEDRDEYEEEYSDEEGQQRRRGKKKTQKKTIFDVYEPSELKKIHLTDRDNEIRINDIPERHQLREVPMKAAEDKELTDEAEWIYRHAFMTMPITNQEIQEGEKFIQTTLTKPPSAIPKIREALNLMRNKYFEVPFIAAYRKEYVEPELNIEDLWRIWLFDEKWCQLSARKNNLKRLFEQMQTYQYNKLRENPDKPLDEDERILEQDDVERLDAVQTMEELRDIYSHFVLHYGHEIPVMRLSRKKKSVNDADETVEEVEMNDRLKIPKRRDFYTICREAGLGLFAKKFGLSPEQFGENLRDNYQRYETEQYPMEPREAAEEHLSNMFLTTDAVLEGTRHMVAMQIARDPLVRQCVRQVFYERAKINISPTERGKKEIDRDHECYSFKYIKNKPVSDLRGDIFLQMHKAKEEGLIQLDIGIDLDRGFHSYYDEAKQLYYRDEFSNLVQMWNAQRTQALYRTFYQVLYPLFTKELEEKLLQEAKDFVVKCACRRLRSLVEVAPYQAEQHSDEEYDMFTGPRGLRVLSVAVPSDPYQPIFFVMLNGGGQVGDFLKLSFIMKKRNSNRSKEKEKKEEDLESLKQFVLKKRPHVIVIATGSRDSLTVYEVVKISIRELEQENQISPINVELIDHEVAEIFEKSSRAETEFREYPMILRRAISVGRRIQDPLAEFAGLCVDEDELLCLRLHPKQNLISKDVLLKHLRIVFVTVVNEVGVDPNRILDFPHTSGLIQFICGLGPRKSLALIKSLRKEGTKLENRSQLVTVCGMGPNGFLNTAGFVKIDTSALNDNTVNYIEVLDGSRIHPETYEWARKMAVDALEYDETSEESNPSAALEEILESPERLRDLDLDAFAEELERQGFGNKRITLYDIRDELFGRYKDRRPPYREMSVDDRFRLLTGETRETLFYGKLITCVVSGFAYRKPNRERLENVDPKKDEETGLWQCPFCGNNTFADLGEVWTHFDNGSCPGQIVGARTRLENGINGFVPTKLISDKHIKSPQERVKVGSMIHCRVTKIDAERFQVDLTCRTSDLEDREGKYSRLKDTYFDQASEDKDKKAVKDAEKKANRPSYIKRVIVHPAFQNIAFKDAEKKLATSEQGECIVRPSNKGSDHLTVTWKVDEGIYQHIDIKEQGKENAFSLGKSLWIENEEFEDLDEIIARHIQPMASFARDILSHKYYKDTEGGSINTMQEVLKAEKTKNPKRIPYFLSASKEFPGKFLLGYMPRNKPRTEYVSVTPDGYRYRGRVHASLNALFKWFKEHFRDPVPEPRTMKAMMIYKKSLCFI
ncbi:transcription elongation factor SPT6-like [Xenia sp. Carnegie-2017]|uniref:transcription elongation factor SPT6-like n=1 Tax=Xenia sp. Carnegie-2017 TaxID=2897299 RepID=UPI001F0378FF|nr:transcription elongation factor SPT6-like [Xenia sp. Carnegie-2017]